MYESFIYFTYSPTLGVFSLFNFSYSDGIVVSYYGFICVWLMILNIFLLPYLPFVYLGLKNCVIWFLIMELWEFFTYSGYKSCIQYMFCRYFLLVLVYLFILFTVSLKHRFLNFDDIQFTRYLRFVFFVFYLQDVCQAQGCKVSSHRFYQMFHSFDSDLSSIWVNFHI